MVEDVIEFQPGAYDNIPMEEYLKASGLSSSRLSLFAKCPAKFHWANKFEVPFESDALIQGSAFHTKVLEPAKFAERYAIAPECDRRTTLGKQAWNEMVARNQGKTILKYEMGKDVEAMAAAVRGEDMLNKLLDGNSVYEKSLFWIDPDTEIRCKGRLDTYVDSIQAIVDLKSTKDASPSEVARDIFVRGYYKQAAMYVRGAQILGIPARHFIFIFVEKEPPYLTTVARLKDEILELGMEQNKKLLKRFKECTLSGNWPGYSESVMDIGIPEWALNKLKEQEEGKNGTAE